MKIVGIDASLISTGVAVYEDVAFSESHKTIDTYAIEPKETGVKRLCFIRKAIADIISNSDLIVLENYAFARANQAHQIGELGGVLRMLFHENNIPYIVVSPGQVKKFATDKGNATKEKIAVACYKHWGAEFSTNDEADAYVLMRIGMALKGIGVDKLTGYQKEIIKAINKGGKQGK